jgi:hypothetical protein
VDIDADGPKRIDAASAPPVQGHPSYVQPAPAQETKTIYLSEGQPLQIVDGQGRVLQTIMLKSARP